MKKLTTEYLPLESIKRAPRNPKDHDLGAIHRSIERFGFAVPMLMDDRTGRLVAGHGRLDALIQLKKAGKAPPPGILKGKGDWLVPVTRGNRFASDADAEAYLVADNMLVQLGGWKPEELAQVLKDAAKAGTIEFTGYDQDDLDQILKDVGEITSGEKDDEVPKPPKVPVSKVGDMWELGEHRILCGDSTKAEDVKRVMGGERADATITDPPYSVEYQRSQKARGGSESVHADYQEGETPESILAFLAFIPSDVLVMTFPVDRHLFVLADALRAARLELRKELVWVKDSFSFWPGAQYQQQHEPILVCSRKGKPLKANVPSNQSTVFQIARPKKHELHPTARPVELFQALVKFHSSGLVFEPFSGSGTTIIAAEKTGRRCRAIEIAPAYVDCAVTRWQNFTGKKAALVKP